MLSYATNPAMSMIHGRAADDALRGLNFEVAARNKNSDMELAQAFGLTPVSSYANDESAANRHQDRYFHLFDETMLSTSIMGLELNPKSEWLIMQPDGFPIRPVNSLKYVRKVLKFDQTGWEVSPEEGPNRTMQSHRSSESGTLTRIGKQIEISGDSLYTEEGRAFLEMQKRQVQITLKIELCVSALHGMLLSRNNTLDDLIEAGIAQKSFRAIIEQKMSEFAAFQKNSDITPIITDYIQVLQNREGRVNAEFVVMPSGLEYYVRGIEDQLDYQKNGPEAHALKKRMPYSVTTIGPTNLRIRNSFKVLNPDVGPIKLDPLIASKTIGMKYQMLSPSLTKYDITGDDGAKAEKSYKSITRSIKVMDLNEDAKFTISLETAAKHCITFMPDFKQDYTNAMEKDDRLASVDMFLRRHTTEARNNAAALGAPIDINSSVGNIGSVDLNFFPAEQLEFLAKEVVGRSDLRAGVAPFKAANLVDLLKLVITYYLPAAPAAAIANQFLLGLPIGTAAQDLIDSFFEETDQEKKRKLNTAINSATAPATGGLPANIASLLRVEEPVAYGAFTSGASTSEPSSLSISGSLNTEATHAENVSLLTQDRQELYEKGLELEGINQAAYIDNVNRALKSGDASAFNTTIAGPLNVMLTAAQERKSTKASKNALAQLNAVVEVPQQISEGAVFVSPAAFYTQSEIEGSGKTFQPLHIDGTPIEQPAFFHVDQLSDDFKAFGHVMSGLKHSAASKDVMIAGNLRVAAAPPAANLPASTALGTGSTFTAGVDKGEARTETFFVHRLRKINDLNGSDWTLTAVAFLLSWLPFTAETLQKLNDLNLPNPFGYLIVFPHVRVQTATIIIGSGNAGFTATYNPNAWKSLDGSHKKMIINFTVSTGTIITSPQNFVVVDDVAITHYFNGHSRKGFTETDLKDFKRAGYQWSDEDMERPSWYSMLVPANVNIPAIVDVKGYFGDTPPDDPTDYHFITNHRAVQRLYDSLGPQSNPYDMPDYDGSVMRYQRTNSICVQGTQWCYNMDRKDFKDRLPGHKSAFGAHMYPGMMPVINSLQKTFQDPMLSDYNDFDMEVA